MTLDELVDFISDKRKMKMSHVYQPVLIRALVDAGGIATVRQLAQAFVIQDEAELAAYEKTIRRMPLPVLSRRGVVSFDGDVVRLSVARLKLQDRARVRAACEQRLQEYVADRGDGIWDYKALAPPAPGSLRYLVLQAAGQRCAACGISAKERPLDVDHIIPRSRGGESTIDNLQALCSKCNRAKGNRDDTDFRDLPRDVDAACPFCAGAFQRRGVASNGSVFAVMDAFPVTRGHVLIVPLRHVKDWLETAEVERAHADELLRVMRARVMAEDKTVTGFNIGTNCGQSAGQTVMHAHLHLIPRRDGDVADPRGGVRGVISEKQRY